MNDHEGQIRRRRLAPDRYGYQPLCSCGWSMGWLSELSTAQRVADGHERTAR